jgi:hypothetical protein
MVNLSDTITRKFIETIDVSDWEIETEEGYKPILLSNKTIEYKVFKIVLDSGLELQCADNHILITDDNIEIFAKDSLGINIKTKNGPAKVLEVTDLDYSESMYDLSVDSEKHTYYTNDILSHNTTTSVAYILWYTVFQPHKNVAILANKAQTAREILSRYQLMYENLPVWIQQGIINWNKGDIELENGSKVFTAATTAAGIRGQSVNLLYIDEAAIIPNNVAEQFFASVYPVVSAGTTTKIIITSTPLGYNHFWKFWNDAENNRNDFVPLFIPYHEIPGRNETWLQEQKRQLGELKFNQEVLCKFLGSSATLINADTIAKMSIVEPVYSKDGLDVFEKGEKDHVYVCLVDTSAGVGGDYSAFTLLDVTFTPYKIVAKYKNSTISPLIFPTIISEVCRRYNEAHILVEINKSDQVAYILQSELEYENLMFVSKDKKKGQIVTGGFGKHNSKPGVLMDKKVKRIGCLNLKTIVEEGKLLISDADIIQEISTFIESRGSYSADEGYHDDLVMTLVIFSWLTTMPFFKELTNINLRQQVYEMKQKEIEEQMVPIGFVEDGMPLPSVVSADVFYNIMLDLD